MKRILIACLMLGALSAARADEWYVNYQRAKEAVQAHQWQRAIDLLNDAIGDKDASSKHVKTYGMQFIPYFPYIYRGAAYFNLNNRAAAKADLEREENSNASGDDKALLQEYLDQLQASPAPQLPPAVAEQKKPDQEPASRKEAKQPEKAPTEPKQTKTAPGTSGGTTQPVKQETKQEKKPETKQEAKQAPRETAPPPSTATTASRSDTVGQGWLTAAKASLDGGNYRRAKELVLQYRRSGGTSEEAARMLAAIGSIEEQVRTGIGLYFEGKYSEAASELSGSLSRGHDSPHTLALLACAYAAQYLLGGSNDSALKRQALDAYSRARQLDAGYALRKEYISPQIIALLSSR